jgi:hypothetical protein
VNYNFENQKKFPIIRRIKKITVMNTTKNISCIAFLGLFKSNPGNPVSGARIYLETEPGNKLIAFQQTGEAGGVTFSHLDKNVYKIFLEIPKQKESLQDKSESAAANFMVGYHSKKMLLFFQNSMGNFMLKFSDVEKLAESNITPMHETEGAEKNARIVICKLEVTGSYGKLALKLSALSEKKFQKQIKKYEQDAEMALISTM